MPLLFRGPDKVALSLHVNGRDVQVTAEPRRTLLSVLREELGLQGRFGVWVGPLPRRVRDFGGLQRGPSLRGDS